MNNLFDRILRAMTTAMDIGTIVIWVGAALLVLWLLSPLLFL